MLSKVTGYKVTGKKLCLCQEVFIFFLTLSTGSPQGCVLSPMHYCLYASNRTSKEPTVKMISPEKKKVEKGVKSVEGVDDKLACSHLALLE